MTKGNILHHTIGKLLPAVVVLLPLAVGSCTTDETSGLDDGQPVIVTAYATESALTRAVEYVDHGEVTSGTYYLSYPQSNSTMNTAKVVFDETGYGKAEIMSGDGTLIWKHIGNGSTDRSLGLTNVSPEKHYKYDGKTFYYDPIVFKDDEKQFTAGRYIPYGDEENTNDILLASKSSYRSTTTQDHTSNYVHFELHHCMARVRVIVETHPNKESLDLLNGLLDEAKVDITKIVHKPYSFIPYIGDKTNFSDVVAISADGTLDKCKFEDINLLNTLDENDESKDKGWAEQGDLDNKEYPGGKYFTTYDILLPPQQLRTDDDRPRLRITVKDKETGEEKTYSGVLPHIMYDEDDNPLQFEFLAEHLLTIRTSISNDPPELVFMPVKVVDWVDKGEFNLTAQQAGIYNEDDFKEMMGYYEDGNKTKLLQFGAYKNGKWVFEIFRNLSFESNKIKIKGQMPVKSEVGDYSFDFNTWFTVKVDGQEYTAEEFKALLTNTVINTKE